LSLNFGETSSQSHRYGDEVTSLACASCGSTLTPNAKFCAECGLSAAVLCATCGTPAAAGRFCAECGSPLPDTSHGARAALSAGATHEDPPTPVAERRIASLLFADLVGFTAISEERDSEEVRELLSAYFDRSRAVIERYGGTVEKFIGDAVFAVWGVPVAREDDAERAVRAGLDLMSAVTALGEELGIDGLAMRVGITTGQVAVSLGAVGEGMVAGDAVNTAARVQSTAQPGQVWVDDTTRSLTTASLAYSPVGSFELKGKAVPMPLFHAVRTTGNLGGDQRVDGLEAPFVGRDRDLRLVKELFHATVEEGRPRLLLIAGEPGIGKSRLGWEFEKYVDAIPTLTTYWMRARCLSYGEGVAGRTVAELIRYLLRLTGNDDDTAVRAALSERLAQTVPEASEREVLRPRLESLLGLNDRIFEQADLFACWRAFLESLHRDGDPVTVVIDDLQWADDGLLDFIEHLLEAARTPMFILALARTEVTDLRPGLGGGRRSTTLFLDPLGTSAMSALLDGLVSNISPLMRDELVRRAEGVPLYAVETIRTLIDRDIVVPSEGQYAVDAAAAEVLDLDALGPPASLQALLAARLDALTDAERRVVQDASVLGLTFTFDGLRALSPSDSDLETTLSGLRHKEIVTIEADPRSPERGQFRFVQAMLRGVAYDTLSRRDRQSRHLAAAAFLSAQPDVDAMSAIVAEHYLDAVAAMPDQPEAAAAMAKGQQLLEQAAAHAVSAGAARGAVALYDRLLDLAPPEDTVITVTLRRTDLVRQLGQATPDTVARVDAAIELARLAGRTDELLRLRLARANVLVTSAPDEALVELREIFDACVGHPERVRLMAGTARTMCMCAQGLGDPAIAREAAQAALDHVERFGDDTDFVTYLTTLSMHYSMSGYRRLTALIRGAAVSSFDDRNPASAVALLNLVACMFNDQPAEAWGNAYEGHRRLTSLGLNAVSAKAHLAILATILGTAETVREVREQFDAAEADGQSAFSDWEAYLAVGSAVLACQLGEPDLVLPAVPSEETSADPISNGWWLMREAAVSALDGRSDDAAKQAAAAVHRMMDLGLANEDLPPAYLFAMELLHAAGMSDELEELTATLETLSMGQRFNLLHATLLRARALLSADPAPGLRAAIDAYDAMAAGFAAAMTRVELAEQLVAHGASAEAALLLDAAETTLGAISAQPGLARIETVRESFVAAVPS
jgi:class 3 adenylate cyclase